MFDSKTLTQSRKKKLKFLGLFSKEYLDEMFGDYKYHPRGESGNAKHFRFVQKAKKFIGYAVRTSNAVVFNSLSLNYFKHFAEIQWKTTGAKVSIRDNFKETPQFTERSLNDINFILLKDKPLLELELPYWLIAGFKRLYKKHFNKPFFYATLKDIVELPISTVYNDRFFDKLYLIQYIELFEKLGLKPTISVGFYKPTKIRLGDLNMSARLWNCLSTMFDRDTQLKEVAMLPKYQFRKIRNFGKTCMLELEDLIERAGLHLY